MASRSTKVRYGVAVVLAAGVLFDLYARGAASFAVTPLALDPATRVAVLVFHGSDGRDDPEILALSGRLGELIGTRPHTTLVSYIWSPWSDARFRAGANGDHVGKVLGTELAALPDLEAVHLVAHSAGAYVLNPLCDALRARASHPVRVEMTYLDPMGIHGAFDFGWGARTYGACADYAAAYVNTDDFVPGTNAPLEQAWNVDVTEAGRQANFPRGGHRWPVRYYLEQVAAVELGSTAHSHTNQPRGAVVKR